MAANVETALKLIFIKHGSMKKSEADTFLENLQVITVLLRCNILH